MAKTFKPFLPQDFSIIPFNAHKQYNFTSASAVTNKVSNYGAQYTSESVSFYSSASAQGGAGDTKNVIKYNQLDHAFYRTYKENPAKKRDFIHLTKQRRDLYQKANILSIPSGLYGFEVRPSSFYLSSSQYEVTDDKTGNLIISGTIISNYPNVDSNVFRLDPIKGFKKYDLGVYDGYAVKNTYYVNQFGNQVSPASQGSVTNLIAITNKQYWRQGSINPNAPATYTTPLVSGPNQNRFLAQDKDDSYAYNPINYHKVTFNTSSLGSDSHKFPSIKFDSTKQSHIKVPHHERYNFNTNRDFSISFYITPSATGSSGDMDFNEKRYIIAKSGTKTVSALVSSSEDTVGQYTSNLTLQTPGEVPAGPSYPFEIYVRSQSLYFSRSDGASVVTVAGEITSSTGVFQKTSHIFCQSSSSKLEIFLDGTKIASEAYKLSGVTKNEANLYIGSRGHLTSTDQITVGLGDLEIGEWEIENYKFSDANSLKFFNGELSNINIWSRTYNQTQINNISESINASPYIGNIFYQSGIAAITHPKYHDILRGTAGIGFMSIGEDFVTDTTITNGIHTLQFQGSHLMYEHEYHCNIQEHEFNHTFNVSARNKLDKPYELSDFTTSSNFTPYVSTIGLYNEGYELIAVAKLASPIPISNKTDTTFVVRYDT